MQLESTFACAEVCLLTELAEKQKIPLMREIGIFSKDQSTERTVVVKLSFPVGEQWRSLW